MKNFTWLPILVGTSIILVSCQSPKIDECNQLNQVINSGKSLPVAKNSDQFKQLSQGLEQLNLEMQAIALNDQKLKDFQTKFSRLYESMSQASTQIDEASRKGDRNLLIQAQQKLNTLTNEELILVSEINEFCLQN